MFENLQTRLSQVFRQIRGKHQLSAENIEEALREVRMALLEADVNYKAVRQFIRNVNEKAVGQEVLESLEPGQQVIRLVHDELVSLLGTEQADIKLYEDKRAILMMVGLQGSGKTTTSAKLCLNLKQEKRRKPGLVAADVYRPAAIQQLQTVGAQVDVPVFTIPGEKDPVKICKKAISWADDNNVDTLILDTAGRLHVDEEMMEELVRIKSTLKPDYTLLVLDAMTGQDAVRQAKTFQETLDIDGGIMTKLDGDSRGGAALSFKSVVDRPIYYAGIGEKLTELEKFHPERVASRILGMGDVMTLIEKAEKAIDSKKAIEMQKKLRKESFTLEDFLEQIRSVKKMGSFGDLMKLIPGMSEMQQMQNVDVDDRELVTVEAIICSMTQAERETPKIISNSRRKRIAEGSGTTPQEVTRLLKQFEKSRRQIKQLMNQFGSGGMPNLGGLGGGMGKLASLGGKLGKAPKATNKKSKTERNKNKAKRKRKKKK